MTQVNGISQLQLRRVNSFQGLMIDAAVWQDAHEYHRNQMRLHHLALHGWGVVQGLEVQLAETANSLLIEPGVAIDPSGNFVIANNATPFQLEHRESVTLYLVLQFREVLSGVSQLGIDGAGPPTRIVEAYQIQQRDRLPSEPCLELARIDFDPGGKPISLPADPEHPGKNELDLRFRPQVGGSGPPTSTLLMMAAANGEVAHAPESRSAAPAVAERRIDSESRLASSASISGPGFAIALASHAGAGWDQHREGLSYLAREAAAGSGLQVRTIEAVAPAEADDLDLLYVSGQGRMEL